MGHVQFRGLRRAAFVVTAATTLVFASEALAAVTPAVPPAGAISTPSKPRVDYDGNVAGTVPDAETCEEVTALGTCSDFIVETVNAGQVEAQITWINPFSDLDLFVFECAAPIERTLTGDPANPQAGCDTLVAPPSQLEQPPNPPIEEVVWEAKAGTAYLVRAVPFFALVTEMYHGCVAYTTTGCEGEPPPPPPPPPPTSESVEAFTQGCPPDASTGQVRKISGGGHFDDASGHPQEHFSFNVREEMDDDGFETEGKIRFTSDPAGKKFQSKEIGCASYTDEGDQDGNGEEEGRAEVRGIGHLEQKNPDGTKVKTKVCYRLDADDNRDPGNTRSGASGPADTWVISFFPLEEGDANNANDDACVLAEGQTHGGPINGGNVQYRSRMDG